MKKKRLEVMTGTTTFGKMEDQYLQRMVSLADKILIHLEYLTPKWLCDCITEFARPFGGIDLDLCGNRDSIIQARYSYGEQSNGTFVNAFQFKTWCIPKDSTETICNGTKHPKFVYLNPPTRALNKSQTEGASKHLQPNFITKLIAHITSGTIENAIVLVPLDTMKKWQHELLSRSFVCMLKGRLYFDRSTAASQRFSKKNGGNMVKRWDSDPNSRAVFWISSKRHSRQDKERFCKIFGTHGFIPGYNLISL